MKGADAIIEETGGSDPVRGNSFLEKDYYRLFDLPRGASPYEVRRAYQEALEIYHEDSLVSYSLFSPEERKRIRALLDEAFATLMDPGKRAAYDLRLFSEKAAPGDPPRGETSSDPAPPPDPGAARGSLKVTAILDEELKARVKASPAAQSLMAGDVVTGADLKRVREELALSLELIAEQTRIRLPILRSLEEDAYDSFNSRFYLKSFLKTYARSLHLDAEEVANRYLKRWGGKD